MIFTKKKFEKDLVKFFSLLVYILPLALITGPFLSDFIISLLGIYFIIISITKKEWSYYQQWYVYLFLLYCLYLIIISLFSKNILLSLESSFFYFRYLFFVLGIIYLIDKNREFTRYFYLIMQISLIAVIITSFAQLFFEKNIMFENNGKIESYRFSGLFGDEKILGKYLSYMFPIYFCFLCLKEKLSKTDFALCFISMLSLFFIILITGERTSFFLFILCTLIIFLMIKNFKILRLITILSSVLCIFLIINFIPSVKQRIIVDTVNSIGLGASEKFIFSKQHQSHYLAGYEMFLAKPIVGHGPKMFREICSDYDNSSYESKHGNRLACSTHPHNYYIQLLSETGVIGTLPLLFALVFSIFKMIQHSLSVIQKNKIYVLEDYQICLWAMVIVTLFPFVPTMNFFNNWISIFHFIPLPFLFQDKLKLFFK